jgi:hypothetical protein
LFCDLGFAVQVEEPGPAYEQRSLVLRPDVPVAPSISAVASLKRWCVSIGFCRHESARCRSKLFLVILRHGDGE